MTRKEMRRLYFAEAGSHYRDAVVYLQAAEDVIEEKSIPRTTTVAGQQQEVLASLIQVAKYIIAALAPDVMVPEIPTGSFEGNAVVVAADTIDGIPVEPEHAIGLRPTMVGWEFHAQQVRDRDERIRFLEEKLKTTEEVHRNLVNDYHDEKRLSATRQRTIETMATEKKDAATAMRVLQEKHDSLERSITPITNQHNIDTQKIAQLEQTIETRNKTIKEDTFRLRELDGYRVMIHGALSVLAQVAATPSDGPLPFLVRAQAEIQQETLKKFMDLCRSTNTSSAVESQYAPFAALALNRLDRARFVELQMEMLTILQKLARAMDSSYNTHDRVAIGPSLRAAVVAIVQRAAVEITVPGESAVVSWDGSLAVRRTSEVEAKRMAMNGESPHQLTAR